MAITIRNYQDLVKQVKMWTNRKDFTDDEIQGFVYFTGAVASQTLRTPAQEAVAILPVSEDGRCVIPFDYQQLRSLTYQYSKDTPTPLNRVSWEQLVNYLGNKDMNADKAAYFARQGSFWFIAPKPTGDREARGSVTCHYYRTMPDINPVEPTNWLVELSPMAYLWGALHHAFLYIMDEERAAFWGEKFNQELTRIQDLAEASEWRGSRYAVRSVRSPGDF